MTARRRAPRGEGERLREEILDAAEDLLLDEGAMDAVSVRAIADEVGVTPPSIYLHFDDKSELFFRVCERRFAEFAAAIAAADAAGDTPSERLEATGRAYVRYGLEAPEHYLLILGPGSTELVAGRDLSDAPGTAAFERLVGIIADGIASGEFRDGDPRVIATSVWGAVHGLVMIILSEPPGESGFELPGVDHLIETTLALCMDGVRAGPPPGPRS